MEIIKSITSILIGLIFAVSITSCSESASNRNQLTPNPISNTSESQPQAESDLQYEGESDLSQPISEWSIISDYEAISFWNSRFNIQLNQEDRFVGLLFPNISRDATIYSAPYYQLVTYYTTEAWNLDEENLTYDTETLGNRSWVSCSNVVFVFPESEYDTAKSFNDEFCDD